MSILKIISRAPVLQFSGITLLILLFFIALFITAFSERAMAVTLKEHSIISGKALKLGDIFDDLPSYNAERVLGNAPHPGQDLVLNARTLMRIASAMDVRWRPQDARTSITITRAATLIDNETIKETLRAALRDKGINGDYNIIFSQKIEDIILPLEQQATIDITELNIRPDQNWFEATLISPSEDTPLETRKIRGTIERLVQVPVLKGSLRHGTVITRYDLDFMSVQEKHVKGNTLLNEDDIIGLTPRRVLLAGKPIKANDIITPKIVSRGDIVTMNFRSGGLNLSAKGKALEHGAKGDTIRLVNFSTHKSVEGIVTASREVLVRSF